MRTEVHVHGTLPLRPGANLAQIEAALQPWLDYLDVESLDELKSVHRDEPGLVFDARRRQLEICWTGDVGRNFRKVIEDSLQALSYVIDQQKQQGHPVRAFVIRYLSGPVLKVMNKALNAKRYRGKEGEKMRQTDRMRRHLDQKGAALKHVQEQIQTQQRRRKTL